jgi:hypothetical protein
VGGAPDTDLPRTQVVPDGDLSSPAERTIRAVAGNLHGLFKKVIR